jgi:hypothetical protein
MKTYTAAFLGQFSKKSTSSLEMGRRRSPILLYIYQKSLRLVSVDQGVREIILLRLYNPHALA